MKVAAALSGGVDSAVAAARLVKAGHEVTAIHMALQRTPALRRQGSRGCCSLEDASDARQAAQKLGLDFYVWDLSDTFTDLVVRDFIDSYGAGLTPNPCIRCNEFVKFRVLLERAEALGFDAVATGHYARLEPDDAGGAGLRRAVDLAKDQSYVLAASGRAALARCLFPLGDAPSKAAVRQEAAELGLGVARKRDSYDICFIPDGDTRGYLREQLGERPGPIVDGAGTQVGEHLGAYQFTVGQRKGLSLSRPAADGRPRYVTRVDTATNVVQVGPVEALDAPQFGTLAVNWLESDFQAEVDQLADVTASDATGGAADSAADGAAGGVPVAVQVRAHSKALTAQVTNSGDGFAVQLGEPLRGLAPGQSAVFYRGDLAVAQAVVAPFEGAGSRSAKLNPGA
ncbi:MAG: tRNA 2-thiouridine(34) synthase MnmA [Bifidobacteriaceae bacterium]|jgi:tRNA-specific 2-thiouridylase|nr:tRNA 2-thiouridine(34) synthase MnmA [Bifidobacteriaceae bacterium]